MLTRRAAMKGGLATALMPTLAMAGTRSAASGPSVADVLVLGAGLSGLNAALLMEEQGFSVSIIEARSRPGGRILSLEDLPGQPDAGGSVIAPGYARLVDRANQFGVTLKPMPGNPAAGMAIHLSGRTLTPAQWASAPGNPFAGTPFASMPPYAVGMAVSRSTNPFQSVEDWRSPSFAAQDVSIARFLGAKGWTPDQIDLAFGTNPGYGNSAHDLSMLMMWHIVENFRIMAGGGGPTLHAQGGNMRIPQAMAAALKTPIRFGQQVVGIRSDAQGVEAVTADGTVHRAKRLLCTLPTSALRLIRFAPALPPLQQAAIDTIDYNRTFLVFFAANAPFWEKDGLPVAMWTDGPAGRLLPLGGEDGAPPMLLAYVNGFMADRLDRMAPDQAVALVQADIERIRPAAAGHIRALRHVSWQRDPFAGGAYTCWKPGQISAGLAGAFDAPAGRIHFAGEHTARLARGMEGAMESGEIAAFQIMEMA